MLVDNDTSAAPRLYFFPTIIMQHYLEHVAHELYMTEMAEDECGGMGGLEKDIIARL